MNDELKAKAIELREQGYTYPQIVEMLSGSLSLDQCKYWLKGVKRKDSAHGLADKVTRLAKRPEGCTNAEIRNLVFECYGEEAEELLKDQNFISNLKKKVKARKGSEDVLFRPQWMKADEAMLSLREVNSLANCIFERLQEMAAEYCYEMDIKQTDSVIKEVVKLANGWAIPENLSTRLERNEAVAVRLTERVKQIEHNPKSHTPPYDEEYDRICI